MAPKRINLVVGGAALALAGAVVLWAGIALWRHHGVSPVERGRRVAARLGCFNCHGPGGIQGIPDAGEDDGKVPSWDGGTLMMYAKREAEVREWILDGIPARLKQQPSAMEKRKKFLIRMPAYKRWVKGKDLTNLVAYVTSVGWFDTPEGEKAQKGRDEAREHGCFGCHGPEGRGSNPNPGSLKGYVPGWDSRDFADLVKNDRELEEWMKDGISTRMKDNPLARWVLAGQAVTMPAFRSVLDKDDIETITAYIHWLRR